jgi:hypothetical protein
MILLLPAAFLRLCTTIWTFLQHSMATNDYLGLPATPSGFVWLVWVYLRLSRPSHDLLPLPVWLSQPRHGMYDPVVSCTTPLRPIQPLCSQTYPFLGFIARKQKFCSFFFLFLLLYGCTYKKSLDLCTLVFLLKDLDMIPC